jgi:hypothetical protein
LGLKITPETFTKVRELSRIIHQIQALPEHSPKQKTLKGLIQLWRDIIQFNAKTPRAKISDRTTFYSIYS